jgi:tetratricopeptide (TPR) repeat protein
MNTAAPSSSEGPAGRAVKWGAVALALLGAAVFMLFDRLAARFAETSTYALKLEVWPQAFNAAKDFWRTGMGRGAFEVGFTRFSVEHLGKTFTHPENFVLQLLSEMGFIAALAVIALAGFALVRQLKGGKKSPLELAVAVAAVAVVLHNLFDFNLEFIGVALPLCVVFGVACGDTDGLWALKVRPAPMVAGLGALMAVAFFLGHRDLREQERDFLNSMPAVRTGDEARAAALPLIAEHPADYVWYSAVAAQLVEKRPLEPLQAIAFANRALFLYPRDFRSHHIAARALRALGHRSQALLEYRLAFVSSWSSSAALDECVRYAKDPAELRACVPEEAWALDVLFAKAGGPLAADACVAVVTEAELRNDLAPLAVTCSKLLLHQQRLDDAIAVLDAAQKRAGASADLAIGRADILKAQARPDDAVATLENALKQAPAHFALTLALADAYMAGKRYEAARSVVVHTTAVTTDSKSRATLKTLEGDIDQAIGQLDRAVTEYRAAAQLVPTAPRHYAVAGVLMKQRAFDDAWAEIRAGQRLDSPNSASATEEMFKTLEQGYRQVEAAKQKTPR